MAEEEGECEEDGEEMVEVEEEEEVMEQEGRKEKEKRRGPFSEVGLERQREEKAVESSKSEVGHSQQRKTQSELGTREKNQQAFRSLPHHTPSTLAPAAPSSARVGGAYYAMARSEGGSQDTESVSQDTESNTIQSRLSKDLTPLLREIMSSSESLTCPAEGKVPSSPSSNLENRDPSKWYMYVTPRPRSNSNDKKKSAWGKYLKSPEGEGRSIAAAASSGMSRSVASVRSRTQDLESPCAKGSTLSLYVTEVKVGIDGNVTKTTEC